jgi:uncharacterized protein (TIGR02452 family)
MSVLLEVISIIIPIEKIEKYYPGGFEKYKQDHSFAIQEVKSIWFDDYIVREGAMNDMDIHLRLNEWKKIGLKLTSKRNGIEKWQDLCVVNSFGESGYPCDWLIIKDRKAYYRKNITDLLHDPVKWLNQFYTAIKQKRYEEVKQLRKEIFRQTLEFVERGYYALNNKKIKINNSNTIKNTYFYDEPPKITKQINQDFKTKFSVVDADCIETAELLDKAGYNVCTLNMANRQKPGGGVFKGAGAQEENIFRRTNIHISLFQFVDDAYKFGIKRRKESYPLNRNTGGIYSADVAVFRGAEENGYCLRKKPFYTSFVSVPAINRPKLEFENGEYHITKELIKPTKEKIRTILRIAYNHNHDCVVLGAFGCGAFQNPPNHVAKLFKEVFREKEFKNRFKIIVFAILDDHNNRQKHNPEGNILPFLKEFM